MANELLDLKQNDPIQAGPWKINFHQLPLYQPAITMLAKGHPTLILIDIGAKSKCLNPCLTRGSKTGLKRVTEGDPDQPHGQEVLPNRTL